MNEKTTRYYVSFIFGILFLSPIVTYCLVSLPTPSCIRMEWESEVWIGFFSGLFAALISAIAAYVILIITYKQNSKNHSELKQIQVNSIMMSFRKEELNNLINSLFVYKSSVNYVVLVNYIKQLEYKDTIEPPFGKEIYELASDSYAKCKTYLAIYKEIKELEGISKTIDILYNEFIDWHSRIESSAWDFWRELKKNSKIVDEGTHESNAWKKFSTIKSDIQQAYRPVFDSSSIEINRFIQQEKSRINDLLIKTIE